MFGNDYCPIKMLCHCLYGGAGVGVGTKTVGVGRGTMTAISFLFNRFSLLRIVFSSSFWSLARSMLV